MAARDNARLEAVVHELAREGLQASAISVDITSTEGVQEMLRQLQQQHATLDVLANMTGRSMRGVVEETSAEEFAELLDLNFLGMVRTIRAALPSLRLSGGSIVNMGSLAGKIATPLLAAYPVSKFAVTAYSQQLRLSLAPQVHVLLVCPGPIRREDAGTRYREQVCRASGVGAATRRRSPAAIGRSATTGAADCAGLRASYSRDCDPRVGTVAVRPVAVGPILGRLVGPTNDSIVFGQYTILA